MSDVVREALERAISNCGSCWGDHHGACEECRYLRHALATLSDHVPEDDAKLISGLRTIAAYNTSPRNAKIRAAIIEAADRIEALSRRVEPAR